MSDPDERRYQFPLSAIPLPEKQLTRRRLLGGAGLLASVGVAELVPLGGIAGWTPAADTWPLTQHDLANTGGTDAPPPSDPAVAWTADPVERRDGIALVVGPERVYVGSDGLAALSRADGSVAWFHEGFDSGELALRGGTLYCATATENFGLNGEDAGVGAFDAATGERRWLTELPQRSRWVLEATSLLVAEGTVLVGHDFALSAYDAGSGRRRFVAEAPNGGTFLALSDGDLYATGGRGSVIRYRARNLLDVPTASGPPARWRREAPDTRFGHPPVATGSRLFCGRLDERGGAGLVARDTAGGDVEWSALSHPAGPVETEGFGPSVLASPVAVSDGVGVTGVQYGGDQRPTPAVVGFGPSDGSVRWRDSLDRGRPAAAALAGGTALVAVNSDSTDDTVASGEVRTYDPRTGESGWCVELPEPVAALAPVAGTVFVVDDTGAVHALR